MNTKQYFTLIEKKTQTEYDLAGQPRKNGCDPAEVPEI
jgi:hypothetical protein